MEGCFCMAVFEGEVSDDLKEFIPNVYTNTPSYGKAFCEEHCKFVTDLGYPTNLREFLKSCSDGEVEIDPEHFSKAMQEKVDKVLCQLYQNVPASSPQTLKELVTYFVIDIGSIPLMFS